jgi:hypothetical protein
MTGVRIRFSHMQLAVVGAMPEALITVPALPILSTAQ